MMTMMKYFRSILLLASLFALTVSLFLILQAVPGSAQDVPADLLEQAGRDANTTRLREQALNRENQEKELRALQLERLERARQQRSLISRIEADYLSRLGATVSDMEISYFQNLAEGSQPIERESQESRRERLAELRQGIQIRQFGYDIFNQADQYSQTITGRIPDDYILGVGDEIVVSFIGSTERTVVTRVDSEGRVVVSDLNPIPAAGRTFGEFRADVDRQVEEALIGTDVIVSVGTLRLISVFVVGEVAFPGIQYLTSLSGPLEAVALAGGVKKTGSLRNIMIRDESGEQILDLYDLMASGEGADIHLMDGATIVVPSLGPTAAIAGKAVRPAIYELSAPASDSSFDDLLALGGGPMRPRGNAFILHRLEETGLQSIRNLEDMSRSLSAGDILEIRYQGDMRTGEVYLEGEVRVPGRRSLAETPTVSELLNGPASLGDNPYTLMAILETTDQNTLAKRLVPVNIERVLSGAIDYRLQDKDRLYVFAKPAIDFLSSSIVRNVILGRTAPEGACPALVNLSEFLADKEFDRFPNIARSIFVIADAEEVRQNIEPARSDIESARSDIESVRSANGSGAVEGVEAPPNISQQQGVISLEGNMRSVQECPTVFNNNPDYLLLALEQSIALLGAVFRPGIYPVSPEGTNLSSLATVAGGLTNAADISRVEVLQTQPGRNGEDSLVTDIQMVNGNTVNLATITIEPTSAVRFNRYVSDQESGTVLLSGEFVRPGIYPIRKGETLLDIIERAGGLTEFAYPYGAVFTRESVRAAQRESFRRTAREINSALASAAIRANVDSGSIQAAQQLAGQLRTADAVGRLVVEADPIVLRSEPRLDIVLQGGDRIIMPKRPQSILVSGDVLNPGALQFRPNKEVRDYLRESGGLSVTADDDRVFIVYPNGIAQPVSLSSWSFSDDDVQLPPGTSIIVPKNLDPFTTLDIVREITGIFSQLAVSAASLAVISNN